MLRYGARKTLALLFVIRFPIFFWRTREVCRACGFSRRAAMPMRPEIAIAYLLIAASSWVAFAALFLVGAFFYQLAEKVH